jgi:hypothetical protein
VDAVEQAAEDAALLFYFSGWGEEKLSLNRWGLALWNLIAFWARWISPAWFACRRTSGGALRISARKPSKSLIGASELGESIKCSSRMAHLLQNTTQVLLDGRR